MQIKRILLAVVLTLSSLISFATDYYKAVTNVNVRSGEGTNYPVSFTLQKGSEVEVSTTGEWCQIEYFGRIGYVHSKYLAYSRTTSDIRSYTNQTGVSYVLIGVSICLVLFLLLWLVKEMQDKKLIQSVTQLSRGERTERNLVLRLIKSGIPPQNIFHDLYVENYKGKFSQIDLVAVTEAGIIVFEVKDYSGWLYGSGSQQQWTKVLAYGKQKFRFYNPILQNNRHITELKRQLDHFKNIPFYSVIVFYGDCELKDINYVPNGTFLIKSYRVLDVVKQILNQNAKVLDQNDPELFRILKQAVTNGGVAFNRMKHKKDIEEMLGKNRIFE